MFFKIARRETIIRRLRLNNFLRSKAEPFGENVDPNLVGWELEKINVSYVYFALLFRAFPIILFLGKNAQNAVF